MQILSIDTSGQILSIAILRKDVVELSEYPSGKINSEKILPDGNSDNSTTSFLRIAIDSICPDVSIESICICLL